jgi:hypothetical protein
VTVLGGAAHDLLQGSVGSKAELVKFSNGSIGLSPDFAGADNITSNASGGDDAIFGDGGADNITLAPNHSGSDTVVFGAEFDGAPSVLAITDGTDSAYLGFWSAPGATPIPQLFPSNTGGTSADMTTVTRFNAGSSASHDVLEFDVAGWNGASTSLGFAVQGDLVTLSGLLVVPTGAAQLSAVWVNSSSNGSLKTTDDVLLYAPSDASLQNAQQLAAQLHTAADGVVMPGLIPPGADVHILVAYPAGNNAVNIADVDLVNTGTTPQTSTANFFVHVYASDMVHLTGVALTDLTSANIQFFTNTLT